MNQENETLNAKPKRQRSEKEKTKRALNRLIRKAIVVAAIAAVLLIVVGGVTVYHSNSMFPAVKDGDLAIFYRLGGFYNGDIVIYEKDGENYLGRIVGIPGDKIELRDDGSYLINDTVPYETIYFATKKAPASQVRYPYKVQEGEYFILNDMREDVEDSRMYGGITKVKGKVVLLLRRRGF